MGAVAGNRHRAGNQHRAGSPRRVGSPRRAVVAAGSGRRRTAGGGSHRRRPNRHRRDRSDPATVQPRTFPDRPMAGAVRWPGSASPTSSGRATSSPPRVVGRQPRGRGVPADGRRQATTERRRAGRGPGMAADRSWRPAYDAGSDRAAPHLTAERPGVTWPCDRGPAAADPDHVGDPDRWEPTVDPLPSPDAVTGRLRSAHRSRTTPVSRARWSRAPRRTVPSWAGVPRRRRSRDRRPGPPRSGHRDRTG